VVRRVLQQLQKQGDTANHKLLLDQYQYNGMETCAVDGLCATACPVDINTGDLIKRLRKENHSAGENKLAFWVAKHFTTVEYMVRLMLKSGTAINKFFGQGAMSAVTRLMHKVVAATPQWSSHLGKPPKLNVLKTIAPKTNSTAPTKVIYFPACITRLLGSGSNGQKNLMETFVSVCRKSNIDVAVMDNINGSCCSQIFSSKGFADAYKHTANRITSQMWTSTAQGTYPIVIDVSSCAHTLHHIRGVLTEENRQKFDQLTILDSVDFLHDYVLPVATRVHKKGRVVLHPVCSLEKMKTTHKFENTARHFAAEVTIPAHAGCCGMAGDRGFLFPELTAAATYHEAVEVRQQQYDGYYSSTKTCEMALSEAVQQNYQSILYLVDESLPNIPA
jgi:D-lactate dehydrogenase